MNENFGINQIINVDFTTDNALEVQFDSGFPGGTGASALADLTDVSLSAPSGGQALIYDGVSSKWVNTSVTPGAADLSNLGDVNISSPSNDQVLKYDSTSGKWVNGTGGSSGATDLDDLSDVTLTTPSTGQVLKYDGTLGKWTNEAEVVVPSVINDLTDISAASPSDGQILKYNSDSGKWEQSDYDYNWLENLPKINGIELHGDLSSSDIKVSWEGTQQQYDAIATKDPLITYFITDTAKIIKNNIEYTTPSGASDLDDLTDVEITTPSAGQVLKYSTSLGKWVNSAESAGTSDLSDLGDVAVSTPSDGQFLKFNASSNKWVNAAAPSIPSSIDDLSDVAIATPSDGQVLKYDATSNRWINSTGGGTGATDLSGLNDVAITTPSASQVLKYNGTSGKWENSSDTSSVVIPNPPGTATETLTGLSIDGTIYGISSGVSWIDLTGTLTAGSTSITFTNVAITTTSTVQVFTSDGTEYNSITISTGEIILTFDAQSSDLSVKVRLT